LLDQDLLRPLRAKGLFLLAPQPEHLRYTWTRFFFLSLSDLYFARAQRELLKMGKTKNAEHPEKIEDTENITVVPLAAHSVFSVCSAFSFFLQRKAHIVPVHGIFGGKFPISLSRHIIACRVA
jgi:hypothetical protein